jgi:hypothetical protein
MYNLINNQKTNEIKLEKKQFLNIEELLSIPEIFEYITCYLESNSTINLLHSSPVFYSKYAYNPYIINKILNQILEDLNIKLPISSIYSQVDSKEQRLIFNDMVSISLYFSHLQKYSFGIGDLITFLVDRNKRHCTSYVLFEHLLVQMNKTSCNPRIRRIHGLDCNQVSSLIEMCDNHQLSLIFEQIVVPKNVICTSIKNLLSESTNANELKKLKQCIRYFLIKSSFGNRRNSNYSNDYFLSDILTEIVKFNQVELMDYILKKRDFLHIYFDYSQIVLRCIELDRIEMLNTLIIEHNCTFGSKKPLFITGNVINSVVERGSFKMLYWIVDNLLGKMINLNVYINCITSALHKCKNIRDVYLILSLSPFFNVHSKQKINDALNFTYYIHNIPFYNKLYFELN